MRLHFAVDRESIGAMADQAADLTRPKGSTATKHGDRFQDARLARAIWPKYVTTLWVEPELGFCQAAQRSDPDSAQRQRRYPPSVQPRA